MKVLINEIRNLIRSARQAVVQSVDLLQVRTCFEIGRRIFEHEQQGAEREDYCRVLLKDLSAELTAEFGRGFSRSYLENMRKFYLTYQDRVAEISQMPSGKFMTDQKSQMVSGTLVANNRRRRSSGNSPLPFQLNWSQYVFLEYCRGIFQMMSQFSETGRF